MLKRVNSHQSVN